MMVKKQRSKQRSKKQTKQRSKQRSKNQAITLEEQLLQLAEQQRRGAIDPSQVGGRVAGIAKGQPKTAVKLTDVRKLQSTRLRVGIAVDGSSSMTMTNTGFDEKGNPVKCYYGTPLGLLRKEWVWGVLRLLMGGAHMLSLYGRGEEIDERNLLHDGTVSGYLKKCLDIPHTSGTDVDAFPRIFEDMDLGSGSPAALVLFGDGFFTKTVAGRHWYNKVVFRNMVETQIREGKLNAVLRLVLVVPPDTGDDVIASLRSSLSHVLLEARHTVGFDIIKEAACADAAALIRRKIGGKVVPKGHRLVGNFEKGFVVDEKVSPAQIAASIGQLEADVIPGIVEMMLEFARTTPEVIKGPAYGFIHGLLGRIHDHPVVVDGEHCTVKECYIDKMSQIKATASENAMRILADLSTLSQLAAPIQLDEKALPVVSRWRLVCEVPGHDMNNMIRLAITDGSYGAMETLLGVIFGRGSKWQKRGDVGPGGMYIPDPVLCEGYMPLSEVAVTSLKGFLGVLGAEYAQKLNGAKLWFTLFMLISNPNLEVPPEFMATVQAGMTEKVIMRTLGAGAAASGAGAAEEHKDEEVKFTLPDVAFTRPVSKVIRNVLNNLETTNPILESMAAYASNISTVYLWAEARKKLVNFVMGLEFLDEVPAGGGGMVTYWLHSVLSEGTWFDPAPQLPSGLKRGGRAKGQQREAGDMVLTYMDNWWNQSTKAAYITALGVAAGERWHGNAKERKKRANAIDCLSREVPDDTICMHPKCMKLLGDLSDLPEDTVAQVDNTIASMFAKWKVADWQKPDMDYATKKALRAAREEEIRSVFEVAPVREKRVRMTEKQADRLLSELFPDLNHFRGKLNKRDQVEDVLAEMVRDGAWTMLKRAQGDHSFKWQHFGEFRKIPIKQGVLEMIDAKWRKLSAPPPVTEVTTSQQCALCMEPASRDERIWIPCGHALCRPCRDGMQARFDAGETIRFDAGGAGAAEEIEVMPMNMASCPACRSHCILDKSESHREVHKFMETNRHVPGRIYRHCTDCKAVYEAGSVNCAGSLADLQMQCEKCRPKTFFECPNCKIQAQHSGGCRLMRCCVHGWHGCPNDSGLHCTHCMCGRSDCTNLDHSKGCGHTYTIGEEQVQLGN